MHGPTHLRCALGAERVAGYLARLGLDTIGEPTAAQLARLHRAHMLTVPFENLDIALNTAIVLDIDRLYDKIVVARRGGFCYELNGLFACLLSSLGYAVTQLSARVYSDGKPGPDFDHMLLRVDLDPPMIADVGFGDSFIDPLQLTDGWQSQSGADYRLAQSGDQWTLSRRTGDAHGGPQYQFTLQPRSLRAFAARCLVHQTAPDSVFTRKVVCSMATANGRVTFSNGRWIETTAQDRRERVVTGLDDLTALLRQNFCFDLGTHDDARRLLRFAD